jgi:hypothetical protein
MEMSGQLYAPASLPAGKELRYPLDRRSAHIIVFGRPEGKRPLGRHRHRWDDNIRMDLKEMGWEGVDWIHLV